MLHRLHYITSTEKNDIITALSCVVATGSPKKIPPNGRKANDDSANFPKIPKLKVVTSGRFCLRYVKMCSSLSLLPQLSISVRQSHTFRVRTGTPKPKKFDPLELSTGIDSWRINNGQALCHLFCQPTSTTGALDGQRLTR